MLAINMADVVNVLNTCKPYLIGFWSCFRDRSDRADRGIQTEQDQKKTGPLRGGHRDPAGTGRSSKHDLLRTDEQHDLTGNRKWNNQRGYFCRGYRPCRADRGRGYRNAQERGQYPAAG